MSQDVMSACSAAFVVVSGGGANLGDSLASLMGSCGSVNVSCVGSAGTSFTCDRSDGVQDLDHLQALLRKWSSKRWRRVDV